MNIWAVIIGIVLALIALAHLGATFRALAFPLTKATASGIWHIFIIVRFVVAAALGVLAYFLIFEWF